MKNKKTRIKIEDISIKWKFFVPLLMIFFIASGIQLGLALNTLRDNLSSQLLQKGLFLAQTLSYAISEPLSLGVIQNIQYQLTSARVTEKELEYIQVVDLIGDIKAYSGSETQKTSISKENLQLLNSLTKVTYTLDNKKRLFTVKIPISVNEGTQDINVGFLEFALTTKYMERTKLILTLSTLSIFLILIVLAILLANYITNKIILIPFNNIEASVKQVGLGNLNRLIHVTSNDELGYFAKTFNDMLSALKSEKKKTQEYLIELTLHKEHLEDLVNDRTIQLEEKNKQITDEIYYAANIQSAILPKYEILKKFFKDHFTIWTPREIVGGDFYWIFDTTKQPLLNRNNNPLSNKREPFFIAVGDCTGHGVPGAFMTMMANSMLNQITADSRFTDPALILQELNRLIRITLRQNEADVGTDDGLDIGICYINPQANTLTFAGAKLSLYHCSGEEVFEHKGGRQSIGYHRSNEEFTYQNHIIQLTTNMSFYITSDGYIEQYGGEKKIPFGKKRLKNIINQIYAKPFYTQKEIIVAELAKYRQEEPQVDDITMLGFTIG